MSLLNDALRAAEQRQDRPVAPGAYMGGQPQSRRDRPVLVTVLVVLSVIVAGMAAYWLFSGYSAPEPSAVDAVTSTGDQAQNEVATSVIGIDEPEERLVAAVKPIPPPGMVEPDTEQRQDSAPEPTSAQSPRSEPSVPEATAPNVIESETARPSQAPVAQGKDAEQHSLETKKPEREQADTADIKRVPETPAAIDRSTARDLERLVAQGGITEAERQLAALTQRQDAPRSRYVVARALLVDGKQGQALGWLPAEVTAGNPALRLLKARALYADNKLVAALNTLRSSIPPVEGHAEYRVTLATLLQQEGDSAGAARHWAELIAWDDRQAPWWVGLAISLEAQGERAGAARAYRQAAELPGLPRSLADYVRQRLQALRAG
jgi:MSHA biogenesis protein MshN